MTLELRKTVFDILKKTLALNVIIFVFTLFLLKDYKSFLIAQVFGFLVSSLLFYDLAITVSKAVKMNPSRSGIFAGVKYTLRFVITGVVIYVSIKSPNMNVYGAVVGILSIKVVIYISNIFSSKKRKEE